MFKMKIHPQQTTALKLSMVTLTSHNPVPRPFIQQSKDFRGRLSNEYTEIKLKELTEGTYKETHVKRKQLRDEKYRKIREQMLKYDNTNVLEYLTDMINIM